VAVLLFFNFHQGRRPRVPSRTPAEISEIMLACWDENSDFRPTFGELVRRYVSLFFFLLRVANK
jgi:hypothetical protein